MKGNSGTAPGCGIPDVSTGHLIGTARIVYVSTGLLVGNPQDDSHSEGRYLLADPSWWVEPGPGSIIPPELVPVLL
eukprot:1008438-Rhodomonas_salina.6